MSAITVIEALIKLGTIISDVKSNGENNESFDFSSFLNSSAPSDLQEAVSSILEQLKPDELEASIVQIEEKQSALLSGKNLSELDNEKLIQYATLVDSKLLLQTALVKRSIEGDLFSWLADEGLEKIIKVAGVVLPLLL